MKRLIERAAASGTGKRLYSYGDALRWCTQVCLSTRLLHGNLSNHPSQCCLPLLLGCVQC